MKKLTDLQDIKEAIKVEIEEPKVKMKKTVASDLQPKRSRVKQIKNGLKLFRA